jgi:hypothetical protein
MNNRIIGFTLSTVFAAAALSSCSGENSSVSRQQVDNSLKNAGATFHTAVDKTSESMKELGPRLDAAKQKAQSLTPALDKAEQGVKNAGSGLGKVGLQIGNSIDSSAKAIKQGMSRSESKPSGHSKN